MNNFDISIIIPSIRIEKQPRVVESLELSTKRNFQIIFAGPNLHPSLFNDARIGFVKTFRAPTPASNIAATLVESPLLTYFSDDSVYFPGELDNTIDSLLGMGDDPRNVVINKYTEGGNLLSDRECYLNVAYPRSPHIPDGFYIFNLPIMYTEFFYFLQGFDNTFQGTAVSAADLAARAQLYAGAKVLSLGNALSAAEHEPGTTGTHAPIHFCQGQDDEPLYKTYWCGPTPFKRSLNINDWRLTPPVWKRRFDAT